MLNDHPLHGRWRLLSFDMESKRTGECRPAYGSDPSGLLVLCPDGKMMALVTASDRQPPSTDAERADLLRSMLAYAGSYRVEGDEWITTVDLSWNPSWVGTEQTRQFELDGDRLRVLSTWYPRDEASGGPFRGVITWKRDA